VAQPTHSKRQPSARYSGGHCGCSPRRCGTDEAAEVELHSGVRPTAMRCGVEVFMSLRGSRGGRQETRWSSGAHRVVARREGGGGGGAPRQWRCFSGRSWLGEGPAAPKKGGNSEGSSKSKQCRVVVILTMKRGRKHGGSDDLAPFR
jgi:hypothetical protein